MTVKTFTICDSYKFDQLEVADGLTADGYLPAMAKVARTGIQIYSGAELGRPDLSQIRVFRPETEVFHKDSLKSYAHRPITLDHPSEMVSPKNYSKLSKGHIGGDVLRDGDFIRVPMLLMDQEIIDAVRRKGVKELSMGYTADFDFTAGRTEDGKEYDAVQSNIRINHLAVVRDARGGSDLRIEDTNKEKAMKVLIIDKVSVKIEDESHAQIIERAIGDRDAGIAELQKSVTKLTADAASASAKAVEDQKALQKTVDELTGKLGVSEKAVKDAALTPDRLEAMVADFATVKSKALAILGDSFDLKGKTVSEIKKLAVGKHLGDAWIKDKSDDAIGYAFDAATATIKGKTAADHMAGHIQNGSGSADITDAEARREKAFNDLNERESTAWMTKPPTQTQQ